MGACKKSEPPKKPEPAKPAVSAPAPKPAAIKPEPKKAPIKTAAKPVEKKPAPVKAARKAPKEVDTYVKEITNFNTPEVLSSGKLSVVYFYGSWTRYSKMLMGVLDEVSIEYKGRANFFRIDGYSAMRARTLPAVVTGVPTIFFVQGERYEIKQGLNGEDPKQLLRFFVAEWLDEDLDEDDENAEGRRKLSTIPLMDPARTLKTVTGPEDPLVAGAGRPAFIVYYDTWVGETAGAFRMALADLNQRNYKEKPGMAFFKVDADKARKEGRLPKELKGIPSIILIKDGTRRVHPAFKQKSTDEKVHAKDIKAFLEGKP